MTNGLEHGTLCSHISIYKENSDRVVKIKLEVGETWLGQEITKEALSGDIPGEDGSERQ